MSTEKDYQSSILSNHIFDVEYLTIIRKEFEELSSQILYTMDKDKVQEWLSQGFSKDVEYDGISIHIGLSSDGDAFGYSVDDSTELFLGSLDVSSFTNLCEGILIQDSVV